MLLLLCVLGFLLKNVSLPSFGSEQSIVCKHRTNIIVWCNRLVVTPQKPREERKGWKNGLTWFFGPNCLDASLPKLSRQNWLLHEFKLDAFLYFNEHLLHLLSASNG